MEQPIFNKKVKLEKFDGKGGWTFARLKGVKGPKTGGFNWFKVKGSIDDYIIPTYSLMPMAKGEMIIAVKAEIRKKIKKEAGDSVQIVLYLNNDPVEIPPEFLECLRDDPVAHKNFFAFTDAVQIQYINWIYEAKKEETRISRMAAAINRISRNKALTEQKKV
jgi:hypothetical protein